MIFEIIKYIFANFIPIMFGFFAVVGAIPLLIAKKQSNIILGLLFSMVSIGCLYFYLNAVFIGVIQIIVYTGAILMAFIFILSYTSIFTKDNFIETIKNQKGISVLFSVVFLVVLIFMVLSVDYNNYTSLNQPEANNNVKTIGIYLFKLFWIAIIASGLLLSVVVYSTTLTLTKNADVLKKPQNDFTVTSDSVHSRAKQNSKRVETMKQVKGVPISSKKDDNLNK